MDIGIESQLLSQDGQETQPDYPMDYDLSTTYNPTPTGSGGEFITASLQRHPARQQDSLEDDDEDEDDDDDDGVDQVIESRRRVGADDGSLLSSRSLLERPQHAHLSPRSAAALTSSLSNQGQLMSGPFSNSSITPVLNGLSQQQSRYDGNPHFRRVSLNQQYRDDSAMGMIQRPFSTQYETILRNERSYGGCGEGFPVASTEALGDVWPLKFEMCFADGGEFNAAHAVENVLKNDSSVYCSRRSTNINICLKLAEPHKTCFLTQFKAKSPTTGFTAPCKEGLIFISHQPILLEETNAFDDMTRELYDEYMEKLHRGQGFEELLRKHGANADALVPAGFFQIDGPDETCTLDLTPNRSCRYVLIKLLRSRCTNSLQRPENIDLQYLGMIGYTGARSFASGSLL
ncbi:hypothetical protein BGX31_003445 [Mortierella sp. GBA43]|nr:hypothetical protein BGX31_003445 [Mortierella sp. GBA43]